MSAELEYLTPGFLQYRVFAGVHLYVPLALCEFERGTYAGYSRQGGNDRSPAALTGQRFPVLSDRRLTFCTMVPEIGSSTTGTSRRRDYEPTEGATHTD